MELSIKRQHFEIGNICRRLARKYPVARFSIRLPGAAIRSDHLGNVKPRMVFEKLNKALADSACRAEHGDIEFLHGDLLSFNLYNFVLEQKDVGCAPRL